MEKRTTQEDPQNEVVRQPISKKTNLNLVPRSSPLFFRSAPTTRVLSANQTNGRD